MSISVINSYPLISCLCVSKNRSELLKKSIDLFRDQIYPKKELIIVFYEEDKKTKELSTEYNDNNIKFYENSKDSGLTLGELRNYSVDMASGEYVAIFDDDDFHSKDRLVKQYAQMASFKKEACSLARLSIYDCVNDMLGITNKRMYGWEGSLMCKKELMRENLYLSLNKQEDTKVIDELGIKDLLHIIDDHTLYTYFFHSKNTSGREHLNKLWDKKFKMEEDKKTLLKNKLQKHIELHKQIL